MLKRWIIDRLQKSLSQVPAVVLLGARQVGKTWLARAVEEHQSSVYLDLETPEDLLRLSEPGKFFDVYRGRLIILDEIQRAPNLFIVLRGVIDKGRARGHRYGQFLLLGSVHRDLLQQSSENLAGRISYIEMGGFNALEITDDARDLRKLWFRGGFPESYLAPNDDVALDWLEDLIRTYLERDVPQMGFRVSASRLRSLWRMLAHFQGETINLSKLAGNLELQRSAINRYIDILVDLLLIRRLQPWRDNLSKRLIKSPRYYIRDSGILHRLLGINSHDELISNPALGKSWEGFVVENIHAVLPHRSEIYFYRTVAGAEVDLVLRLSSSEIWAVEIKYGTAPKPNKHYSRICEDIGATKKYIVYGGDDEFPIRDGVTIISLPRMMRKIAAT